MKTSINGISLIKHFEGLRLKAYKDNRGIPTIGYGATFYENGNKVKMGDVITQQRADTLFMRVLAMFEHDVNVLLPKAKQNEFDACVSFAYNVGSDLDADDIPEGLGDSTLLKLILKKAPCSDIYNEFLKWNKSGGKVLDGLTARRKAEAHLFCTGELILPR